MNNKTNTDINTGRTKKIQSPFQDFKRTIKPEEKEEQHQHSQHSIQSQKEVRKNQFYQLLKRNQQIS